MNESVLGIDFGTSSVKVMCIARGGGSRMVAQPYESQSGLEPGTDPESWWMAMGKGLRALSQWMAETGKIHAIGLTAQVGTYLLQDASTTGSGFTVTSWRKGLGEKQLTEAKSRFSESFFNEHISMNHPKLASYPIPRILHYQEDLPEKWERAEKLLQPKDYLYYRLTGTYASDPFSWRGLANLADSTFHEELLNQIGMSGEKLPALYGPGEAPGHLLQAVADELSLPGGIPVFIGCNDFFSSLLGMGIMKSGQCFDVSGTSEHVGMIRDTAVWKGDLTKNTATIENELTKNMATRIDDLVFGPYLRNSVQYGVTANSGASMSWAFKTFGRNPEWTSLENRPEGHANPPPPIFLPYLQGERAPIWDSKARGVFFGLSGDHQAKDLSYSVLEGVVFSLYHIWTLMSGEAGTEVRVGGGAAFDDELNRMKASIFQLPFHVMREKESGALGAAMFAAIGTGWFSSYDEAIDGWVKVDHTVEPNAKLGKILRSRFGIYKDLYPVLKEAFSKWAELEGGSIHGI